MVDDSEGRMAVDIVLSGSEGTSPDDGEHGGAAFFEWLYVGVCLVLEKGVIHIYY